MAAIGHAGKVEIKNRQRLEALDVAIGIIVEDNALVQQSIGIEDSLELLHGLVGLIAPLVLNKRSHISTRTVLGLQRAVVTLYNQLSHIAHHLGISSHLVLVGKALVQNEVVVALEGVTVDAGIVVAVVGNKFLQFNGSLGQTLDWEGNIFDKARCADGTGTAHAGEDARADGPVLTVNLRIFGELSRYVQAELAQALLNLSNLIKQLLVGNALSLGKNSGQVVVIARLNTLNLAGINILLVLQVNGIIDRAERLVIEHLGTFYYQVLGAVLKVFLACLHLLHGYHSLAALLHCKEVNHGRSLERIVLQRLHRHLTEERQCTL